MLKVDRRREAAPALGVRLALAGAVVLAAGLPFAWLIVLVESSWAPLRDWDAEIAQSWNAYAAIRPDAVALLETWTTVFHPWTLRLGALALVIWLLRRGAARLALWVATTMLVAGLLGLLFKLVVGRVRPRFPDPVSSALGPAFPSGHALTATVGTAVLVLVVLPLLPRRWRPLAWVLAGVVTIGTGMSRIALGVHWFSDVVGGWLLGAGVVAATALAFGAWRHDLGRPDTAAASEGLEPELAESEARRTDHLDAVRSGVVGGMFMRTGLRPRRGATCPVACRGDEADD
jgi:membrane-associated phospholipid phosphatase